MTHQLWLFFAWVAIALNIGGYFWQAWLIFKMRSGEAVSVAWFASSVGLEIVNVIYGWSQNDRLFIYNAVVCAVGQIMVLLALKIYKPFGKKERCLLAAITITIVAALVLPFRNAVQMIAQAINLYGAKDQPDQLKANRDTGALALWALVLSGSSALIWTAYCWVHFGFWGPAVGFLGYTSYTAFMVWKWCKKARSAKSS